MTKLEAAKAYNAGRAAHSIKWPEGTPEEIRRPGTHHCPFPEGDPQRAEWLRGYKDAIDERVPPPTLVAEIEDALEVADSAR